LLGVRIKYELPFETLFQIEEIIVNQLRCSGALGALRIADVAK
jgi:hypothetical protein